MCKIRTVIVCIVYKKDLNQIGCKYRIHLTQITN